MASNKDAGSTLQKITGVKTYDLIQYVTGWMDGEMKDWPANIQDAIHAALDAKAAQVEHPLTIIYSRCDVDYGEAMDRSQDKFYVHVIASEIVIADEKFVEEENNLKEMIADIMAGRKSIQ